MLEDGLAWRFVGCVGSSATLTVPAAFMDLVVIPSCDGRWSLPVSPYFLQLLLLDAFALDRSLLASLAFLAAGYRV